MAKMSQFYIILNHFLWQENAKVYTKNQLKIKTTGYGHRPKTFLNRRSLPP